MQLKLWWVFTCLKCLTYLTHLMYLVHFITNADVVMSIAKNDNFVTYLTHLMYLVYFFIINAIVVKMSYYSRKMLLVYFVINAIVVMSIKKMIILSRPFFYVFACLNVQSLLTKEKKWIKKKKLGRIVLILSNQNVFICKTF